MKLSRQVFIPQYPWLFYSKRTVAKNFLYKNDVLMIMVATLKEIGEGNNSFKSINSFCDR